MLILVTGEFGKAFDETCKDKTEDGKQRWIRALIEIASIAGEDSQNWSDEAKMIEQISNHVSNKLFTPSDDFRDFVGIQAHIEAMMDSMLCLEYEQVRMVGIVGPSGIGKSTIARALYSRLSTQFHHRAFETCKRTEDKTIADFGMKLCWAKHFLSEILCQKEIKIESLGVVEQRLKHKKVLIVLDDVDDLEILKTLVGQPEWFGSGSRIIVVTQDMALLKSHGIKLIYEVQFPSEGLALQMFCRSAFGQNSPPYGFIELAVEVANLAGNLPLGLSVLGSSLRDKDKKYWEEMMPRLRNGLNGKIEKTLRICYDGLDEKDDQDIFLYIACLFNGERVINIKNLWDKGSYTSVNTRLRTLADKSLIRITAAPLEKVQMHILLQKLGKEIVRAESINNPGRRRCLVDATDISDVCNDNIGTEDVLGIRLDISEIDESLFLDDKSFDGMHNLQFIKFYQEKWAQKTDEVRLYLPQGLAYLPRKLRLLHWDEYSAKHIPCSFSAKYLRELRMEDSKLEKLWEGIQPLGSLKKMNIAASRDLKEIPDLSSATNLEILDLCRCTSLVTLSCSIRNLKNLVELRMDGCSKLEVLPIDINLESLDYLSLMECSRLRSFPRISRNISRFSLDGTAMEEEDCFWIENLLGFTELDWENCPLRYLPSNFHPEHLLELTMRDSKLEKLWEGVQSLGNLRIMDLLGCENLKEIPNLSKATNLEYIGLSGCESLKAIPDLSKVTSLEILELSYCTSLVKLPSSVQHLDKLRRLDMRECTSLEVLPTNINLVSLTFLNLDGCSQLTSFPQLSTSIKELNLSDTAIEEVPFWIENFAGLTLLQMRGCEKLRKISATIWNLKHLKRVDFTDCGCITSVTDANLVKTVAKLHAESIANHPVDIYPSLFCSGTEFLFRNCCSSGVTVLPDKEVSTFFTHCTRGTSLLVPLLQSSLSQNSLGSRHASYLDL